MKTWFFLIIVALGLGYFAYEHHQQLEHEKFLAREKLRIAEEERRRQEAERQKRETAERQRKEAERKKKLAECTALLEQKEKEVRELEDQLGPLKEKLYFASEKNSSFHEERSRSLRYEIRSLENQQREMKRKYASISEQLKRLQCYDRCIRFGQIKFRVQMGDSESRKTLNGVYYKWCQFAYSSRHYHSRRCSQYDRNGYWYVRFICNDHNNTWTQADADRYQRYLEQYQNGGKRRIQEDQARYAQNARLLKKKRQALAVLSAQASQTDNTSRSAVEKLSGQCQQIEKNIRTKKDEISRLKTQMFSLSAPPAR